MVPLMAPIVITISNDCLCLPLSYPIHWYVVIQWSVTDYIWTVVYHHGLWIKKKKKCGLRVRRIAMEANFTAAVAFLTAWLDRTALADEDASASTGDSVPSVFLTYCLCRSQTTVPDWWCRGGWHRFQCTRQAAPLSLFLFLLIYLFFIFIQWPWYYILPSGMAWYSRMRPWVCSHLLGIICLLFCLHTYQQRKKKITFLLAS